MVLNRVFRRNQPTSVPAAKTAADVIGHADKLFQELVDSVVNGLGFWGAMVAVVEVHGEEERLTLKAVSTKANQITARIPGLPADMVGKGLIAVGEAIAGQKLINNYVLMDDETRAINKAVDVIMSEKEYVVFEDLYDAFAPRIDRAVADRISKISPVKKLITMPFRNRDGVLIGNLYAGSDKDVIAEDRIKQLQAFSMMATIALENAALLSQNVDLQTQNTRITGREDVLKDTITQMLSTTLRKGQLLQDIVNAVVEKLGFRACMLSVLEYREGERYLPLVAYRFVDGLEDLIKRGEAMVGVTLKGATVRVDEETAKANIGVRAIVEGSAAQRTHKLADLFAPVVPAPMCGTLQRMFKVKAMATVPLRNKKGELIGNLFAGTGREEITDAEVAEMETLALAASIAIENAQHLRETRRMGLLAASIGDVAHRVNGLLGGAAFDIDDLLSDMQDKEDTVSLKQSLQQINAQIKSSRAMIKNMRDHAQKAEEVEKNDLVAVTRGAVDALKERFGYTIPENIKVKMDLLKTPLFLDDAAEMTEVLCILIKNACEAMPDGGSLNVSMKIETPNGSDDRRESVVISIRDTGKGIPPEKRGKALFQMGGSTDMKGLGYGLWKSRLTVEWLEGEIEVKSLTAEEAAADPAKKSEKPGSTFTIRLPIDDVLG